MMDRTALAYILIAVMVVIPLAWVGVGLKRWRKEAKLMRNARIRKRGRKQEAVEP